MSIEDFDDETVVVRKTKNQPPVEDDSTRLSARSKSAQVHEPQLIEVFSGDDEDEDSTVLVTSRRTSQVVAEDEDSTVLIPSRQSSPVVADEDDSTVLVIPQDKPIVDDEPTVLSARNAALDTNDDSTVLVSRNRVPSQEDEATKLSTRNIPGIEDNDSTQIVDRATDATRRRSRKPADTETRSARPAIPEDQKKFFKEPEVKVGTSQQFERGQQLPTIEPDREDFSWSEDERILSLADLQQRREETLKRKKKRGLRLIILVVASVIAIGSAVALALFLLSV